MRPVDPPSRYWEWTAWVLAVLIVAGAAYYAILIGLWRGPSWGVVLFAACIPLASLMAVVGWVAQRRRRKLELAAAQYDALMARISSLRDPG